MALEAQLKAVPREVAAVEQRIAAEKAAIETARTELKELEVRKKTLENDIGSASGSGTMSSVQPGGSSTPVRKMPGFSIIYSSTCSR